MLPVTMAMGCFNKEGKALPGRAGLVLNIQSVLMAGT